MPRIERDSSRDPDIAYSEGEQRVTEKAIDAICDEFRIIARDVFASQMRLTSGNYWGNQANYRALPTTRQAAEHLARIEQAAITLETELKSTGHLLRRWLSVVSSDAVTGSEIFDGGLSRYLLVHKKSDGGFQLDLDAILAGVAILQASAAASLKHARKLQEGNLPGELAGQRVTRSPSRDMPARVLMINLRDMFLAHVKGRFCRGFLDDWDARGNRVKLPNNPASRFVVSCCALIAPDLSGDQIEKLMAFRIKEDRRPTKS